MLTANCVSLISPGSRQKRVSSIRRVHTSSGILCLISETIFMPLGLLSPKSRRGAGDWAWRGGGGWGGWRRWGWEDFQNAKQTFRRAACRVASLEIKLVWSNMLKSRCKKLKQWDRFEIMIKCLSWDTCLFSLAEEAFRAVVSISSS